MSRELKHTVLLIEEDVSLQRLMALGLEYRGVHVIEAGDFSAIETQQADLLVIDVDGGVGSDWSLLAAVASHPYLSTLPMVVLAWEDSLPISARRSNISCLTKPFDARTLHTTIERLLAERVVQKVSATRREHHHR